MSVEGKAGHERQAVGVARLLGVPRVHRVGREAGAAEGASLTDGAALVLAAGRQAIAPARRIARRGERPVAVLQPVLWRADDFCLVWAPRHDRTRLRSANLVETLTAPSVLRPADLLAPSVLSERIDRLAEPRVGVLVGGPSRSHRFGAAEADALGDALAAFSRRHGASVIVATAPRTPVDAAQRIAGRLVGVPHAVFAYDREVRPDRVYAATIAGARWVVVTSDSVAMLSDAVATGRPVFGFRVPGGRAKHERFYEGLRAYGAMRWFDGSAAQWSYPPLDAAESIASRLRPFLTLCSDGAPRTFGANVG